MCNEIQLGFLYGTKALKFSELVSYWSTAASFFPNENCNIYDFFSKMNRLQHLLRIGQRRWMQKTTASLATTQIVFWLGEDLEGEGDIGRGVGEAGFPGVQDTHPIGLQVKIILCKYNLINGNTFRLSWFLSVVYIYSNRLLGLFYVVWFFLFVFFLRCPTNSSWYFIPNIPTLKLNNILFSF